MVKIVNAFGDFKTGKQGLAVYQGRDGQQIRRTLQPKRAIPSEKQLEHRQTYKDALTWRKALSLENRRFLQAYCYSHRVIDSYGIPLSWHKFALKIYLEHVHFKLSNVQEGSQEGYLGTFESQENYNGAHNVWGFWWFMQSFTPLQSHTITSVKLYLLRLGSPGTLYINIFLADAQHKPIGDPLCSGSINANTLPTGHPSGWPEIILGNGSPLTQAKEYLIEAKAPDGNSTNCVFWYCQKTTNPYPRGLALQSSNSGNDWSELPNDDFTFRDIGSGESPYYKTAALQAKHPALLSIVQKRNGITVAQWATLSSLDNNYLTPFVDVDLQAGDSLDVTTLVDRHFTYKF